MSEVSILSRKILRELCNDSRITITELSKKLEVPRSVIARHIKSMENELGLYYTLELDYKALGLSKFYIYHVKFTKKPSDEELRSFFAQSPDVQLAIRTKGDFDLAFFVLEGDEEEFAIWHQRLGLDLAKYGTSLNKSDIDVLHFGFIPLDQYAIKETALGDKLKKILLILSENSRMPIKKLAKQLGISDDLATYHIQNLRKKGIIRRFTTVITKPQRCANILYFTRYVYDEKYINGINEERKQVYFKKEDQLPLFNEFQMVLSLSGGEDDGLWTSANTIKEAMSQIDTHKRIFRSENPKIVYAVVERPLKGIMPIRSLDTRRNYVATEWVPGQMYK